MSGKKVVIVGEMHNDLFFKVDLFKTMIESVAAKIHENKGDRCLDSVESLKTLVAGVIEGLPKKIPGESFIKRGGNGNNSSELFAALGVPVKLMTVVGKGSSWMGEELEAIGVDPSAVVTIPHTTPISTIIEDPVTTKIFVAPNLKEHMNFEGIDVDVSHFSAATLVFFTPLAAKFKPVLDAVQAMKKKPLTVFTIEAQAIDNLELLKSIVNTRVDILFVNKQDAMTVTKASSLDVADEALREFARIRIYTLGAEGTRIASDFCEDVMIPIYNVKVVDRTGAGDAYAAGVLLRCHEMIEKDGDMIKRLESMDSEGKNQLLVDVGRFGAIVAALKISLARTPTKEEIEWFIAAGKI